MQFSRSQIAAAAISAAVVVGHGNAVGPDVQYKDVNSISNYGAVAGIRAFSIGSATCNIGTQNLFWTNGSTPGLAMNAYRLHNGRLMQIGLGFVKTACCAAAGSGCGLPCNGQGGSVLGAGCLDVYDSGWNGIQSRLAPRSIINPFSGAFGSIPGGSGDLTWRRLQVAQTDLVTASFPGAIYFVEGQYIGTDDATSGNSMNNASYRRVNVDGAFNMSVTGTTFVGTPAIYAWRDHGLGVGVPDPSVQIVNMDVPGEGRFILASKTRDNGNGTWRYEYAVYNFNSHRSGGSFKVPVPATVKVSNVGYHDVPYHSGEPYDNTDWSWTMASNTLTWSSPQTFVQNPNSNALRWGTLYNYWFDADAPPGDGTVTLGLFRTGTPDSVGTTAKVPRPLVPGDLSGDGVVNTLDLGQLLVSWSIPAGTPGCGGAQTCPADLNFDGVVDTADLGMMLAAWTLPS